MGTVPNVLPFCPCLLTRRICTGSFTPTLPTLYQSSGTRQSTRGRLTSASPCRCTLQPQSPAQRLQLVQPRRPAEALAGLGAAFSLGSAPTRLWLQQQCTGVCYIVRAYGLKAGSHLTYHCSVVGVRALLEHSKVVEWCAGWLSAVLGLDS